MEKSYKVTQLIQISFNSVYLNQPFIQFNQQIFHIII